MRFFLPFAIFLFLIISQNVTAQDESDWQHIFNGKNLDGWDLKITGEALNEDERNTIRVEDEMLRVVYDNYETFDKKYGHLYYNEPFSHFRLQYEYRFNGEQTKGGDVWNVRNSGVMFHSQSAESVEFLQTFPVSLEMQLLGGLGKGPRPTGNLCTPGTQVYMSDNLRMEHCINSSSETYEGDQWVHAELIVFGDSIAHQIIEEDTVLTFQKLQIGGNFVNANSNNWKSGGFSEEAASYWEKRANTPLKEGYIALQAESHPIDFRNIKLLNLKGCMNKNAKNYKSYYQESDEGACVF